MARKDPTLCSEIRENFEKWQEKWRDNNENYHYFFNFVMGDQWADDESDLLQKYNKVPMVMNKLSPLARHLLGEQRMNTPALKVEAEDDIPPETVTVRQSIVHDIMFDSDARVVFQNAFKQAVIGGFGAFWLGTDYINDSGFEQRPTINALKDPTKCFWDLGAELPDKTDGSHAGFIKRLSRSRFRELYGKKVEKNIGVNYGILDSSLVWANDDEVSVVYSWKRKMKREKLLELSDGSRVSQAEFDDYPKETIDGFDGEVAFNMEGQVVTILRERPVEKYEVTLYETAGDYVLNETVTPYHCVGLIFQDQDSFYDKKGQQICVPFFKDAEDAQKFINYIATQSAYCMKISRYDQFMASKSNIKSPETTLIWKDPSRYQGALIYDVDTENGTKPERLNPPEFSSAFMTMYERSMRDIETSTGMYGARLGDQGSEVSGAAIDSRTRQGSMSNFVVFDSANRAIARCGRMINDAIPKLYNTQRRLNLELPETGRQKVDINKPQDEYGINVENDMTSGEFKVRLVPGPSWEGQQQEALQSFQEVLKASPETFQMIADLYADSLPLTNKNELRNRLRTLVPPEIIEAGKTGKPLPPKQPQQDPQAVAAQQMAQAKMQEVQIKQQELQLKAQEMQNKMQHEQAKMEQEQQKIEAERLEAAAQLQAQELRYVAETGRTQADVHIAHADNLAKILTHLGRHGINDQQN